MEQCHSILGRHIRLDVVVGTADVAAVFAQNLDAPNDLFPHLVGPNERQALSVDPAEEAQVLAEFLLQFLGGHGQRMQLDRLPDIHSDLDQIGQDGGDIPARVKPDQLTGLLADFEDAGEAGLFNLSRQVGGSAGIAFLSTVVSHRTAFHRANMVEHINVYSQATQDRLTLLIHGLMAKGFPLPVAKQQAYAILDRIVSGQASVMAFEDAFLVIGVLFILMMPLLLLFKKGKPQGMEKPAAAK